MLRPRSVTRRASDPSAAERDPCARQPPTEGCAFDFAQAVWTEHGLGDVIVYGHSAIISVIEDLPRDSSAWQDALPWLQKFKRRRSRDASRRSGGFGSCSTWRSPAGARSRRRGRCANWQRSGACSRATLQPSRPMTEPSIRTLRRRSLQQQLRESAVAALAIHELLGQVEKLSRSRRTRKYKDPRNRREAPRRIKFRAKPLPDLEPVIDRHYARRKETPEEMRAWREALKGPKTQ